MFIEVNLSVNLMISDVFCVLPAVKDPGEKGD